MSMGPEQIKGGRIGLALVRAAIVDDLSALDAVSVQAQDNPIAVISALASLLAHTLTEGAGEEAALAALDRWMLALLDEEATSCSDS